MANAQADKQVVVERMSVGLIPKALDDLGELVNLTGLSRANIINRALSVYVFVARQLDAGNDVLVRDRRTGELERVHII